MRLFRIFKEQLKQVLHIVRQGKKITRGRSKTVGFLKVLQACVLFKTMSATADSYPASFGDINIHRVKVDMNLCLLKLKS